MGVPGAVLAGGLAVVVLVVVLFVVVALVVDAFAGAGAGVFFCVGVTVPSLGGSLPGGGAAPPIVEPGMVGAGTFAITALASLVA